MASSIWELFVKLSCDRSDFTAGLGEGRKELQSFGETAASVGSKLAGVLGFAAIGAGAIHAAKQFDEAGAVIANATGATGQKLTELSASFKNVYGQADESAVEVSRALSVISTRTGATGKDLEGLTVKMLDLAKTQREQVTTLAPLITRVFGDWSIATNKQSFAMDYLKVVSQQTGVGVGRLSEQVVSAGAPLRQLGYSFEQAVAIIGKFEKEGVNTELVLGGMKAALAKFAAEGLKDTAGAWDDLIRTIKSGETTFQMVSAEVGVKRATDLFTAVKEGRFDIEGTTQAFRDLAKTTGEAVDTFSEKVIKIRHQIEGYVNSNKELVLTTSLLIPVLAGAGRGIISLGPSIATAAAKMELFAAGMGMASTSYGVMLASGVFRISTWVALAGAIALAIDAYLGWQTAQNDSEKAQKQLEKSVAVLEVSMRQQGIDIKAVSDQYAHGEIGLTEYLTKLRALNAEFRQAHPLTVPGTSIDLTQYQKANQALKEFGLKSREERQKDYDDAKEKYDSIAKVYSGDSILMQEAAAKLQKAQEALNGVTQIQFTKYAQGRPLGQELAETYRELTNEQTKLRSERKKSLITDEKAMEIQAQLYLLSVGVTEGIGNEAQALYAMSQAVESGRVGFEKTVSSAAQLRLSLQSTSTSVKSVGEGFKAMAALSAESLKQAPPLIKQAMSGLLAVGGELVKLEDAFHRLGINSTNDLRALANGATEDYELIRQSGTSSPADIQAAWTRMIETNLKASGTLKSLWDEAAAAIAKVAKQNLPEAITLYSELLGQMKDAGASEREMARIWVAAEETKIRAAQDAGEKNRFREELLFESTKMHLAAAARTWAATYKEIATGVGNAFGKVVQDIGDMLLKGKVNAVQLLEDLGKSIVKVFIDVGAQAVARFVTQFLVDLFGKGISTAKGGTVALGVTVKTTTVAMGASIFEVTKKWNQMGQETRTAGLQIESSMDLATAAVWRLNEALFMTLELLSAITAQAINAGAALAWMSSQGDGGFGGGGGGGNLFSGFFGSGGFGGLNTGSGEWGVNSPGIGGGVPGGSRGGAIINTARRIPQPSFSIPSFGGGFDSPVPVGGGKPGGSGHSQPVIINNNYHAPIYGGRRGIDELSDAQFRRFKQRGLQ